MPCWALYSSSRYFYPRSPYGERHLGAGKSCYVCGISIHALLTESDETVNRNRELQGHFYPRSPYGERQLGAIGALVDLVFLSTLSLRRATKAVTLSLHVSQIFLSTLSLRRATCSVSRLPRRGREFLSTLSLRRATAKVHKTVGHFCAYETNFMEIASSC